MAVERYVRFHLIISSRMRCQIPLQNNKRLFMEEKPYNAVSDSTESITPPTFRKDTSVW